MKKNGFDWSIISFLVDWTYYVGCSILAGIGLYSVGAGKFLSLLNSLILFCVFVFHERKFEAFRGEKC